MLGFFSLFALSVGLGATMNAGLHFKKWLVFSWKIQEFTCFGPRLTINRLKILKMLIRAIRHHKKCRKSLSHDMKKIDKTNFFCFFMVSYCSY